MKYWVNIKNTSERVEGKSIAQIARDLNVSYAVVYKSLQYSLNPELPKGIKLSQRTFDEQYHIEVADAFMGQMVEITSKK